MPDICQYWSIYKHSAAQDNQFGLGILVIDSSHSQPLPKAGGICPRGFLRPLLPAGRRPRTGAGLTRPPGESGPQGVISSLAPLGLACSALTDGGQFPGCGGVRKVHGESMECTAGHLPDPLQAMTQYGYRAAASMVSARERLMLAELDGRREFYMGETEKKMEEVLAKRINVQRNEYFTQGWIGRHADKIVDKYELLVEVREGDN